MKNFILLIISFCVFAAFFIVFSSCKDSSLAVSTTQTAVSTPVAPVATNADPEYSGSVKATSQLEVKQDATEAKKNP